MSYFKRWTIPICSLLLIMGSSLAISDLAQASGAKKSTTKNIYPDVHSDTKGSETFPLQLEATGKKVFIFNPNIQAWAAYNENGERVKTGRASGGMNFCDDVKRGCKTVSGTFSVIHEGGPGCSSSKYPVGKGGAKMPYCMFFHPKGYAIHGSHDVPDYNASHGCIRVTVSAAEWLNKYFIQPGVTVIVEPYQ